MFNWIKDIKCSKETRAIEKKLDYIVNLIMLVLKRENKIMADIENISADLDQIKLGILDAQGAIAELKEQIAAIVPGAATQEQLDALDAKTEEIKLLLNPAV